MLSDNDKNLSNLMTSQKLNPIIPDQTVQDGDTMPFGSVQIQVMSTPGHTRGSCCYLVGNAIFSGDTLMNLSIGRCDFEGGSMEDMKASLTRLRDLPGDYRLYAGHGGKSTLNFEREHNPYLKQLEQL